MIMMMITLMISIIVLLMVNMIVLCICAISLFSSHITCFRHGLVYCVTLYFGTKTTMGAIRRFALGKMPIIVMYVAKCIQQRRHYVHTEKRTIQMIYVMLYFCIVCKLYEFLTYIMYIWTKNIS